jgi:hypothetical protein
MSNSRSHPTVERRDTPEVSCTSTGVKRVFTEVDGGTDCWLAVDPETCVPEAEWR